MGLNMKSITLLIGIPMFILSATAFYYLYKKDEDDYGSSLRVNTSRSRILEMKIPKANVGVVIGRAGSNIKEIEVKSDTKINFSDDAEDEEYRTCVIRGNNESVRLAEVMIHEFIMNQPLIQTFELWVPQQAMGRIIGRCGDNVKAISRASNAKVSADSVSTSSSESGGQRRIFIKGTTEQIAVAKSLIEEKVEEEAEARRKFNKHTGNRDPRNKPSKAISDTSANTHSPEGSTKNHFTEKLVAVSSEGSMEVFVSAVVSPNKFWVQLISPKSVELDHLVEQMTDYYNIPENKDLHSLKELHIGQIVAAPFDFDEKWYRAEVCDIELDEYDQSASKVKLYYVDYGDKGDRKQSDLYQLRTDFLKLHFQAVECCLARVKPSEGEKWTEEAIDLFEELCHVAQWRPLTARTVSYKKGERIHREREGSPIPCVDLFDKEKEIDVGAELVANGFGSLIENQENVMNGNSNTSPKKVFTEKRYSDLSPRPDKLHENHSYKKHSPDRSLIDKLSPRRNTTERLSQEVTNKEIGFQDTISKTDKNNLPNICYKDSSQEFISGETVVGQDRLNLTGNVEKIAPPSSVENLSGKMLSSESTAGERNRDNFGYSSDPNNLKKDLGSNSISELNQNLIKREVHNGSQNVDRL